MENRRKLTQEEAKELEALLESQEKAIVGLANFGEFMVKCERDVTQKERDAYQVLHEWMFGGE